MRGWVYRDPTVRTVIIRAIVPLRRTTTTGAGAASVLVIVQPSYGTVWPFTTPVECSGIV